MTTLTGNLADVTNKAPENISSITVKAPAARIGGSGGSSVIVTSPATVNFNSSTGDITISNLTGGLSWLYIEGDGWADSIGLAVADGMVTLVEAVANALGMPGIVDYIRLLADLEGRIEDVAQGAVDAAAENIKWTKRDLATGEDLDTVITPGLYKVINYIRAVSLVNRPEESNAIDRASLEVQTAGGGGCSKLGIRWAWPRERTCRLCAVAAILRARGLSGSGLTRSPRLKSPTSCSLFLPLSGKSVRLFGTKT